MKTIKLKDKRILAYRIIFLLFLLAVTSFIYSFYVIYSGVKKACVMAKKEYRQDCVNSLIEFTKSEKYSFRERNSAIWALGQLADKKALPFLYELKSSLPEQERCRYNEYLCKYEVEKAIKWCEKGNITSWMYRNNDNWD